MLDAQATITGKPDPNHVSTSYAERHNLTMRMGMRRFTRLTSAFSRKVEHHAQALAMYFVHCNFCRIHQSLRVTPAMAAGATNRLWEIEDIAALVEAAAPKPGRADRTRSARQSREDATVLASDPNEVGSRCTRLLVYCQSGA